MEVMNPQIVPKLPVKPNSSPVKKVKNVFHLSKFNRFFDISTCMKLYNIQFKKL